MNMSLTQIKTIIATTETLGATVPKEIENAIHRADKVRETVFGENTDRGEIPRLVLAAIDAGKDPAADPKVQRELASQALQDGVQNAVCNLADNDVLSALQSHVDELIEAWQQPFNSAVEDIATAAATLGNTDLTDAAQTLHKGGQASEQWSKATKANRTITEIVDAWTLLAAQTGFASPSRHYMALKLTDPTLTQWETHSLVEKKISAWEAHHMGIELSLATRHSYQDRIANLSTTRETRATEAIHRELGKGNLARMGS